ncbi:MAG: hypothetical protein OXE98_07545 [Hyphomicrobiales bacterium]|nr:hypothetical protein [Hyphomicrobiales bacterium]
MQPEQAEGNRSGRIEEVGRADEGGGRGSGEWHTPEICPAMGDGEYAATPDKQR